MSDKKRKVVRRAVAWIAGIALLAVFLLFWTHGTEEGARYVPEYAKVDISIYLEQENLTDREYQLLYRQTGLSPLAIDALWKDGRQKEMLGIQERFFAEAEVCCEQEFLLFNEVLKETRATDAANDALPAKSAGRAKAAEAAEAYGRYDSVNDFMPVLEDGDILITFNSHFLGWRNGHAAIVVDAEKGKTVEALSLGTDSAILSINSWNDCPSFAVLRLTGASKEERQAIAVYAKENLVQQPYRLTAGIVAGILDEFAEQEQAALSGTNCSHLVRQAYLEFGYDLDSDGGVIVTPKDLYESPMLEVVQVYGMKPM